MGGLIDGWMDGWIGLLRCSITTDTSSLQAMLPLMAPGSNWAAFGISRNEMPMVAQSMLLGGHVRVGLEDNLYLGYPLFVCDTVCLSVAKPSQSKMMHVTVVSNIAHEARICMDN